MQSEKIYDEPSTSMRIVRDSRLEGPGDRRTQVRAMVKGSSGHRTMKNARMKFCVANAFVGLKE